MRSPLTTAQSIAAASRPSFTPVAECVCVVRVCACVCVLRRSELGKSKVKNRILTGGPHIPRTVSKEARSLVRGESREPLKTPVVTGS